MIENVPEKFRRPFTKQDLEIWWSDLNKQERLDWKKHYDQYVEFRDQEEAGRDAMNVVLWLRCLRSLAKRWQNGQPPYNTRYLRIPGGKELDTHDERVSQWLTMLAKQC